MNHTLSRRDFVRKAAANAAFYQIIPGASGPLTVSNTPNASYRVPLSAPTEFLKNLRSKHTSVS